MIGSDRRTQVIVGFSAVSKSLAIGIRTHLKYSSERDRKEMLEGLGPLASDAAKLRLARLMGWVPKLVDGGISALRQSRNRVAHDIVSDADIQFPSNLPDETRVHLDQTVQRMIDAANSHPETRGLARRAEHDVGLYALLLSLEALSALMWGPSRLRLGMGDGHLASVSRFDESPKWYAESHRNMADAMLLLTKPSADQP